MISRAAFAWTPFNLFNAVLNAIKQLNKNSPEPTAGSNIRSSRTRFARFDLATSSMSGNEVSGSPNIPSNCPSVTLAGTCSRTAAASASFTISSATSAGV